MKTSKYLASSSYMRGYLCLILSFIIVSIDSCDKPQIATKDIEDEVSILPYLNKISGPSQGLAIENDKIFVLSSGGYCDVYDYESRKFISSFILSSSSSDNHCNCANWGVEKPSDSSFPLLYVTNGQPGALTEWHCKVEKIVCDGNNYSSECVQTIILDPSRFAESYYLLPWGCPQWLVDRERSLLAVWSANLRTLPSITGDFSNNIYHSTIFRLPKLSEGEEVILTADDVLSQIPFEFDAYVTQGGCMFDGKILYSYGFGINSAPSKIRIYDIDNKTILKRIDLEGIIDIELEDISIYNKKIYVNTGEPILYEIKYDTIFNSY